MFECIESQGEKQRHCPIENEMAEHSAVNRDRRDSRAPASSGSNLQLSNSGHFIQSLDRHFPNNFFSATMADRPQQPARPARERKSSPIKTGYLVLYNAVSTILWATILGRVLLVSSVHGTRYVFPAVGEFAKWTQTLALLEVVHAAVGEFGRSSSRLWFGKEVELDVLGG